MQRGHAHYLKQRRVARLIERARHSPKLEQGRRSRIDHSADVKVETARSFRYAVWTELVDIEGVAIQSVANGSPAARADLEGIQTDSRGRRFLGDVVVAVNDVRVTDLDEMATEFEKAGVGAVVELSVMREGRLHR